MCEEPKEKLECDETVEKRLYYYDDAHGYEDFDPEADDDETEKEPPIE